jgi:hypothetical protein
MGRRTYKKNIQLDRGVATVDSSDASSTLAARNFSRAPTSLTSEDFTNSDESLAI